MISNEWQYSEDCYYKASWSHNSRTYMFIWHTLVLLMGSLHSMGIWSKQMIEAWAVKWRRLYAKWCHCKTSMSLWWKDICIWDTHWCYYWKVEIYEIFVLNQKQIFREDSKNILCSSSCKAKMAKWWMCYLVLCFNVLRKGDGQSLAWPRRTQLRWRI